MNFSSFWPLALVVLGVVAIAGLLIGGRNTPIRYRRKALVTENELEFFGRLTRALPGLLVLPQVSMAAVIEPDTKDRSRWMSGFRQVPPCQNDLHHLSLTV